jgi:pimeloyl-ACP methyl ester carboxylesterase
VKTRWKVVIGALVVLAILLVLNTVALNNETEAAERTIDGGEIFSLPGGEVQVLEDGVPSAAESARKAPIVLLHCYSCSLHWWDAMAPELTARGHRVIRIDLLGHGGSEKPSSGYEIDAQAGLVAGALNELQVEGAVVVGHSMGGSVATSLAESASELVDRVVIMDSTPAPGLGGLGFLAKLQYVPVIGEATFRIGRAGPWSDSIIKSGYAEAFAPDFDLADGFENPDQVVEDYQAMTYTSFDQAHSATDDFIEEKPLTDRLTTAAVPVMAIVGSEDQVFDDPSAVLEEYAQIPGAETHELKGVGHSPNVEAPEETAELVAGFAAKAAGSREPRDKRNKP